MIKRSPRTSLQNNIAIAAHSCKIITLPRQLAILIPGVAKWVTGEEMRDLGKRRTPASQRSALPPLTADQQTSIRPKALRQLIGVIRPILEDDAAPRFCR